MRDISSYEVHTSTREELNEGWIWIRNEENKLLKEELEGRRRVVKISNDSKSIYCEALYINDLDLKWIKERFRPKSINKVVFISQWYLRKLGIKKNPQNAKLIIERNRNVFWNIRASLQHPQIGIFISIILGILSVGLGFIGFGLGVIAISSIYLILKIIGFGIILLGTIFIFIGIIYYLVR